jgi:hypothetical protein
MEATSMTTPERIGLHLLLGVIIPPYGLLLGMVAPFMLLAAYDKWAEAHNDRRAKEKANAGH